MRGKKQSPLIGVCYEEQEAAFMEHPWDLSPAEAIALQRRLAAQVDLSTPIDFEALRLVAGVDVNVKEGISRAAIVVLTFPGLEAVETARASMPTPFPYIP
jgi:deoxyribonuclease V